MSAKKKVHHSKPHMDAYQRRRGYVNQMMWHDSENDIKDFAGIMALVLHEEYGFGRERVERFITRSRERVLAVKDGESIREEVKSRTGWDCPASEHNRIPNKRDYAYRMDMYAIGELEKLGPTMYLVLHDEFGFGPKRLDKVLAAANAKHYALWDDERDIRQKEVVIFTDYLKYFGVSLHDTFKLELDDDAVMNANLEID